MSSAVDLAPAVPARPAVVRRPLTRIDRAAVRGLLVGLAALILALLAQGLVEGRQFALEAGGLLLIAGALFARGARGAVAPLADAEPVPLPALLSAGRPHVGLLLVGGATLVNAVSIALFALKREPNLAWLAYLVSLPIALAGVYLLDARPSLRQVLARHRRAIGAVLLLLLVALALRTYSLSSVPFGLWADESMSGNEVLRILREPDHRPIIGSGPSQGLPSYLWYLTAPFFALLGPSELALRLPTAIMGALCVVAVFLLGRALIGSLYGLIAAGVLATLSWHVTFSRIAMNGVHSTLFDAASMAFLIFGIRTGRRSMFALAGLCLGLSQNFYFAARLFVLVAGLYLLHQLLLHRLAFVRRHLTGLVLFSLFALLAASPLVYVAAANPTQFNERAQTVTVFKEVQQAGSYDPLIQNVRKHLTMFNYIGDGNGRHNLPGAPMLETATAALAVLGFVLALTRIRRPEFALPFVWWLVMLQGGIWSLAFEAPQGYRTIDVVVAVALLAALPIAVLAERLIAIGGRARVRLAGRPAPLGAVAAGALVTVALGAVGYENVHRYFFLQATNFAVWAAHATPETLIGRELRAGDTVGTVYYDQVYLEHPTIRFLAPGASPHAKYDSASVLPVRDLGGATVFLPIEQLADIATIRRLYPAATVKEHRGPTGGTVMYEAIVPPEIADTVRGAELRLWRGEEARGEPVRVARVPSIELPADASAVQGPTVASWRAVLAAPAFGRYAFRLEGAPEAALRIDETELVSGGAEAGVTLAKGNHTLEVRGRLSAGPVKLLWRTPSDAQYLPVPANVLFVSPVTNNGLLGSYYRGPSWSGEPRIQQIDPSLQMRIHLLPLDRPYSVEWRGKVYLPADGLYRFGTASRDGSWLYLDERLLVDNGRGTGEYAEGALNLTQGFHDIRIRFLDQTGHTFVNVFWTPPGRAREPLPTALLFPPQGSYPDKVVPPPPVASTLPAAAPAAAGAAATPAAAPAKPAAPGKPVAASPGIPADAPSIPLATMLSVGGQGKALGQLDQPRAAALDRSGNLYVADTGNKRVVKFNSAGEAVASWGDFVEPLGVVVDSSDRIVVLDSEPGWLRRYSSDGQLLEQFGGPDAKFYHPRGLAIDAVDNLYIADTGGGRVVKYNGKGEQVAVIGQRGNGPGQLTEPTGVAVDPMGAVWVADTATSKMVRYGADGVADLEVPLPKAGSYNGHHVELTAERSALITDPEAARLIVLGSDGKVRGLVVSADLRKPVGVSIGPDGRVVVSDVDRHQVVVLAPVPEG
jgi:4-amino-4-deoxy-L-arabinose transferase-like glycosyltransferase